MFWGFRGQSGIYVTKLLTVAIFRIAHNSSEMLTETTEDRYLFYSQKKAKVFDICIGNYNSCTISFTIAISIIWIWLSK